MTSYVVKKQLTKLLDMNVIFVLQNHFIQHQSQCQKLVFVPKRNLLVIFAVVYLLKLDVMLMIDDKYG